jgi:hypothetical protein
LPLLEILGGAINDPLSPMRAEGYARAPLQEIMRDPMGPFGNQGRIEHTDIVRAVPRFRDAQMAVIWPDGGPTPAALKGPHRNADLAKQGLRTHRPGVDVSHTSLLATGRDVHALQWLGLKSNFGLKHVSGHLSPLCKDGQGSRRDVVEV